MIRFFKKLMEDTLMREHNGVLKHSRTSWTMFTAWVACLYVFMHQFITMKDFNDTAFGLMIGVALGSKITDSWSKKLNPEKPTPTNEETK